jgi:hypothetical protein
LLGDIKASVFERYGSYELSVGANAVDQEPDIPNCRPEEVWDLDK